MSTQTVDAPLNYHRSIVYPSKGSKIKFNYPGSSIDGHVFMVLDRTDWDDTTNIKLLDMSVTTQSRWYAPGSRQYDSREIPNVEWYPNCPDSDPKTVRFADYDNSELNQVCTNYYNNLPEKVKNSITPVDININFVNIIDDANTDAYYSTIPFEFLGKYPFNNDYESKIIYEGFYTVCTSAAISNKYVYVPSLDEIKNCIGTQTELVPFGTSSAQRQVLNNEKVFEILVANSIWLRDFGAYIRTFDPGWTDWQQVSQELGLEYVPIAGYSHYKFIRGEDPNFSDKYRYLWPTVKPVFNIGNGNLQYLDWDYVN